MSEDSWLLFQVLVDFIDTDLETIILSEVRERQVSYDITYIWNLKIDTNELIYKTEIDS